MARKKNTEKKTTTTAKTKPTRDVPKTGKISSSSVSAAAAAAAITSIMESKRSSKSKDIAVKGMEQSSYTADIDYPPESYEEDDYYYDDSEEEEDLGCKKKRLEVKPLDVSISEKELRKRRQREEEAAYEAEKAKKEALKDDKDAFVVVIGKAKEKEGDCNVKDISIDNFSVSVRGNALFEKSQLKISHGRRYGFIGPNGMGKSTLLKLLAWGKIPIPKNIDLLLVEQEVVGDDRSAIEAVVSANEELVKLREEAADLQNSDDSDAGEKLAEVYEKLQILGSDSAESQASKILAGLGFEKDMQRRPTKSFSGGWRMRISLARALYVQPTLLLLDEPTNHLDLRAVLWLEEYLSRWKKTLVIVSHDRDFLNTVCTDIIHLHDKQLQFYRGIFDDFENAYNQRRNEMNKMYDTYTKHMKAAKNKVQRDKVTERVKIANKDSKKKKGKGEDEKVPEVPNKWKDYSVKFQFPEPRELNTPLMQLIEVSFSYPNRQDFKLENIDLGIDMGDRIAIVGANGAGKSTLLNLLAGDLSPTEGRSRTSRELRIGRYSQHFVDLLTMEETPVQYLLRLYPDQEGCSKQEKVRAKLGDFGLPSHNHLTPIAKLSGGQKARVVFTSIYMSEPNILLLDEPTNHLDMQSIDALADALDEFTGGVILVSHDSRLISRVCEDEEVSQLWEVKEGTVTTYPGTFEKYKQDLLREIRAEVDD